MRELPIVFAPGMMCDGRLFAPQIADLKDKHDVVTADLARDDTITACAERLLVNAPQRFFLVGLSMGGIVALEAYRLAPQRIAGLALLDTTPFADSPAREKTRLAQMQRAQEGALRQVVMEELKPNYLAEQTKDDQAILTTLYDMADDLGPDVFCRQSKALMARKDNTDILPRVSCPTIIMCGEEDDLCPPEIHELMHKSISQSKLHILPKCGHISSLESPSEVTKAIVECLAISNVH